MQTIINNNLHRIIRLDRINRIIRHRSQGFSLMEVLIAVFVLAVGLLGAAGLQLSSLRSNQTAHLRTIATQQVLDIAERMRSNRAGVIIGAYNAISGTSGTDSGCSINTACTPAQLAAHDAISWNTTNNGLMPGGRGTVDIVGGVIPKRFVITISWDEYTSDKDNPIQIASFSMEVQP